MAGRDDVRRVLARCDSCDAVYAARRWPDGRIQPIGRSECQCGSGRFTTVDGATDAEVVGDEDDGDEKVVDGEDAGGDADDRGRE